MDLIQGNWRYVMPIGESSENLARGFQASMDGEEESRLNV